MRGNSLFPLIAASAKPTRPDGPGKRRCSPSGDGTKAQ